MVVVVIMVDPPPLPGGDHGSYSGPVRPQEIALVFQAPGLKNLFVGFLEQQLQRRLPSGTRAMRTGPVQWEVQALGSHFFSLCSNAGST